MCVRNSKGAQELTLLRLLQIAAIPSDSVTVEQFLQAEMHRMQQHAMVRLGTTLQMLVLCFLSDDGKWICCSVQARLEQLASRMREDWKRAKRELLAEMAG